MTLELLEQRALACAVKAQQKDTVVTTATQPATQPVGKEAKRAPPVCFFPNGTLLAKPPRACTLLSGPELRYNPDTSHPRPVLHPGPLPFAQSDDGRANCFTVVHVLNPGVLQGALD